MKKKIITLLSSLLLLLAFVYYFVPAEQIKEYTTIFQKEQTEVPEAAETDREIVKLQIPASTGENTKIQESQSQEETEEDEKTEVETEAEEKHAPLFSEVKLPGHLLYYYETLSDEEKSLYRELYAIMAGHMDYTNVGTTDSKRVGQLMEYVLLDNPELFYIDSLKTQTTTIGSNVSMAVMAEENMTQNEQSTAKANIENYKNVCFANIRSDMSDYEKALAIYEYVVTHLKYTKGAPYNQSLYSAVLGESVCRGYACAFKYLCDEAGIDCIVVTGSMQGENHAWNMVKIDGIWCQVDCTAGDDLEDVGYAVDYSWFGGSDSYMQATHTLSGGVTLPAADSMANFYYVRQGLYFDSYDFEKLSALLGTGCNFSFQCANQSVYDQYQYEMSNSREVAQAIGQGKSVSFMGNGSTYTIYVEF